MFVFTFFFFFFFFFNDTATTEIYTLSLHDALPISPDKGCWRPVLFAYELIATFLLTGGRESEVLGDRKSTRLNSSHMSISYAVFCLKKKIFKLPDIPSLQKYTKLFIT